MKPVNRTELKRFLNQLPRDQLVNQVIDMWASFPQVQHYYEAKVRPANDDAVRDKYRAVVEREFFPARGYGRARLSIARKAVADYRKVAGSPEGVADLMLFYVETGVRFTNAYGDIDESFYSSMAGMYESALEWVAKHDLKTQFEARCLRLVDDTRGIGWGFPEDVEITFERYFDAPGE